MGPLDQLNLPDLAGAVLGFALTLFIFSYLLGDNPLYRLAIHVFIGAAAGIAGSAAWHYVLKPVVIEPLQAGQAAPGAFLQAAGGVVLCGLLFSRVVPRTAWLSVPALALLVGVGAATIVGGAVLGTIVPQTSAAIESASASQQLFAPDPRLRLFNSLTMLLSTIAVLVYFQYWRKPVQANSEDVSWLSGLAWIGKFCVAATLGVVFAGIYAASLAALIDRVEYLMTFIKAIIQT